MLFTDSGAVKARHAVVGVLVAAVLAVVLLEIQTPSPQWHIPSAPPDGYAFIGGDSDQSQAWIDGVVYRHRRAVFERTDGRYWPGFYSVVVYDFRLTAVAKMFGGHQVPPGVYLNAEDGVLTPQVPGIRGNGDVIMCTTGLPDECLEWSYWSFRGRQLLTMVHLQDVGEAYMTESEFRVLVDRTLSPMER